MANPSTGLVPRAPEPGSALYRHFGDIRAALFGPHALLLQVMHPVVDAGVLEHSSFKTEPFKRLLGTIRSMATVVYGGPDGAAAESRRLRNLHKAIRGVDKNGERYHSLEPEAWAWVYATLVKGSIDAQNTVGQRLPQAVIEQYYTEARELGVLMGIRPKDLPEDWAGFEAYFDTMVTTRLENTQSARDVLKFLGSLPCPFFIPKFVWRVATMPIVWGIRVVTTGTLPIVARERLGLTFTERDARHLRALLVIGKALSFVTPQVVNYYGTRIVGWVNGRRVLLAERKAAESHPKRLDPPRGAEPTSEPPA